MYFGDLVFLWEKMNNVKNIATLLLSIFILMSCENEIPRTEPEFPGDVYPVKIETSQLSYDQNKKVAIEIINTCDSIAMYFKCSSYEGIPPVVYQLSDEEWKGYWAPICNGYNSFCCLDFQAGELYRDTLDVELITGTYRLEYQFIVSPGHNYIPYYSNSFDVK